MPTRSPLDALPAGVIVAIRNDVQHFPQHIQRSGRVYLAQGRVGPLDVQPSRISATVRGTRSYRTSWRWSGESVDPHCTCPAGPVCKHAYALAKAIDTGRHDGEASTAAARARDRAARPGDARREPFRGDRFNPDVRADEPAGADLASDLAHWARRRAEAPRQTLRVVAGLDDVDAARPSIWIEVRVSTAKLADAPRSAQQLMQLSAELRHDPQLLAPPHVRLLRILSVTVPSAEPLEGGLRFRLKASAIIRLLDSFSNSPLVRWDAGARSDRGGITPGERVRLGDAVLDIVPVSSGGSMDLSIMLAARWPDGRLRRLDEIVYVPSDDDLHPSLLLIDGTFWCVGEEPPAHVVRRLAYGGSLPVPKTGREHFLGLLASSFTSVADALAPHMRIHRARPVITLDLGADDWLNVRLFAHTGEAGWRPGDIARGVVAFELGPEGEWSRLGAPGAAEPIEEREPLGHEEQTAADTPADPSPTDAAPGAAPRAGAAPEPGDANGTDPAGVKPVWVEVPDPALVEPAREWLRTLPLAPRARPFASSAPPAAAADERGAWIRLGSRTLQTFAEAWEQRPPGVAFLGNERMRALLGERRSVRPRLTVTSSGVDWFTVSAAWQAEGMALTEADLAKLRGSQKRFVKLKSGWVSRDWIHAYDAGEALLADLGIEAGAGEQRVTLAQLALARPESLAALEALGGDPRTLREIERLRARVRDFAGVPRIPSPERLEATLRPYQRDGLDFLAFVTDLGLGAVLADDMGLGKTVQALAWIEWLRERDPGGGPVLVVCPASVVHNWQRESERFTPHFRVLALTSGEERHALRREVPHHDIVVTNYALLRRDLEYWRTIRLRAAVLDEAQNIKNPTTAMSRAVRELDARHRLALTGTPIENRALDLWSIMQFVNPGYLGTRAAFVARYDRPESPAHARRLLAARLRPVMLRRLKEDVAPDLPDRIEERRECELTPGQRKLYLAELMRGRETVERLRASPDGVMRHKIEVLAALTRLRQICCHPALAGGREELGSGKFDELFELLEPLLAEGRKVLVFSQFVECLKLLAAGMKRRGIRHHMLTGATTRREAVVTTFESDPEPCVFLISLKAGGTGLNLTAAQYVVLFDPWWNPAVEAQAIDRTHRIGQTRTVIAFRMLAAGTIEEKIWELQQRKEALASDVLGEDGFARSLTQGDLDYLLG
jgi:superfamily II DNA or RNA helicase